MVESKGGVLIKKSVTIVAFNQHTLDSMFSYIEEIFSEYVALYKYTVEQYLQLEIDDSSLILLSGYRTFDHVRSKIGNKDYIVGHRYIDYRNLSELSSIKKDTLLYIVNDDEATTIESMRQLREIGYKFRMLPCYPGANVDASIKTAITIGEPGCVPDTIEKVYDVGARVSSISTINGMALKLELSHNIIDTITMRYMTNYMDLLQRNRVYKTQVFHSDQLMKQVFNHSREGMCLLDEDFKVSMVNNTFLEMLNLKQDTLIGNRLLEVLSQYEVAFSLDKVMNEGDIIRMNSSGDVFLSGYEVLSIDGNPILIYSSYTMDVNDKEVKIRRNLRQSECKKTYRFKDYLTKDYRSMKMLERAKRISGSNSSVLIQGESGTGKEILAQAIHNNSDRRNENFVAINFAAIQPSLLESELFGYGKGSFTGANKNGSIGLIEKAHKGTIFFDEIGDAPMSFQVRLLRVLQEREVRRIGETEQRPVDVRVIVATNKDLQKMVAEGTFREDLYYRINVMPLDTIPLRERRGDIRMLLDHYLPITFNNQNMILSEVCSKALSDFLMTYDWKGNVREIINVCEYFACIKGVEKIDHQDLPAYMFKNHRADQKCEASVSDLEKKILALIKDQPRIGRLKISAQLNKDDGDITEGKIRTCLKYLKDKDLIRVNKTRGGTELTDNGYAVLSE